MKRLLFLMMFILLATCLTSCHKEELGKWSEEYTIGMDTNFEECSGLPFGNGETAHVIILTGQSNCTGCSSIAYLKEQVSPDDFERYSKGYDNILINFNIDNHRTCSEGNFRKTDLMCGSYDEQFGPEVGLADKLNEKFPNEKFYILKITMSGYSLNYHWMKDYERGEIYNATYLFVKNALDYMTSLNYNVSLDAVMFMQGESDTTEIKTDRYYKNLSNYVTFIRNDFKDYASPKGIYFIDAGISDSPYNLPTYEGINEAKLLFSKESDLNVYFSTIEHGLTTMYEPYYDPDLGHYDALSELKLGELFAEEYVKIYERLIEE